MAPTPSFRGVVLGVALLVTSSSAGSCDDFLNELFGIEDTTEEVDAPGGCDSADYSSSYGRGDEQMDLMCKAAWGYRCANRNTEAEVTCQSIRDYTGTTAPCPYC